MSGTVVFVTNRGELPVSFGQTVTSGGNVMTAAAAVAADPSLAQVLADTARAVAQAIADGALADGGNTAAAVLAAVVKIAVEADPQSAAALAQELAATVGASAQLVSVINAAAGSSPNTTEQTILPALDQTQVVVSPSRP
jgi:hypothetical protein